MREPAWRIFAAEYNDATHVIQSKEEKAPKYVITPLGAKVNRLFIVGVLTDVEEIGAEGIRRRARISDPTGIHVVYAEAFKPEVASILADMEIPSYIAVVGKTRIYEPEEGVLYLSARAEMAKEIGIEERNYWIIEASRNMLIRINAMRDAMNMSNPTAKQLRGLGYPPVIAEGVAEAIKVYKDVDLQHYEIMLREALSFITSSRKEIKKNYEQEEEKILKIIESLQSEDGAAWEAVIEEAIKEGIEKSVVEEVIVSLMEKGLIYEPQLGKLKIV
ncbi:MAG: hypothetical protein FE048_05575 [Thermoplasmata archaeon]|nr:MAG: hypothetical protein FE048_05575 [Thermoplasmata archaeon]